MSEQIKQQIEKEAEDYACKFYGKRSNPDLHNQLKAAYEAGASTRIPYQLENESLKEENDTLRKSLAHMTTERIFEVEKLREALEVVKKLAEWSERYPKDRLYNRTIGDKMDNELMDIETLSKNLINALNQTK